MDANIIHVPHHTKPALEHGKQIHFIFIFFKEANSSPNLVFISF